MSIPDDRTDTEKRPKLLGLIRRLPDQVTRLIRDEITAARLELTSKLKAAGVGIGMLAGAAILALYALGVLLAAAILGLATALPPWLAALLVAVVLLIVVGILALLGRRALKKGAPPVPTTSIDNIKADIRAVKGD